MVDGMDLHLIIDGTSHDITRSETQTRIVFLHELLAVGQTEDTSVSAHGFRDEVCRMGLGGVKEARRVELYKLHILDHTFGAIDHGYTVTGSYLRVGSGGVDRTCSAGCHEGDSAEIGVYFLGLRVEDIGSVALDIGRTAGDAHT